MLETNCYRIKRNCMLCVVILIPKHSFCGNCMCLYGHANKARCCCCYHRHRLVLDFPVNIKSLIYFFKIYGERETKLKK